jgi:hypothetical protein
MKDSDLTALLPKLYKYIYNSCFVGFEVLTFNGLHGVISQKIELLITTALTISDPIHLFCLE